MTPLLPVRTDLEKENQPPAPFDSRQIARATAAALRRALAERRAPITFGLPDTSFDGRFIETKWGSDFIKEHQFRNFGWAFRWRGIHVGIETALSRACQMNPEKFGGLRRFPDVESYLLDLEGSSTWEPRDGWGLASMWRQLCRSIPESAGTKIAHLYPDRRSPDEIKPVAEPAAEEIPAAEPIVNETPAPPETFPEPAVQITPLRTDLAPEALRYLETGRHD